MTRLRRPKTFRVWLVDRGEIIRAGYRAAALPQVGETIFVARMGVDDDGDWRTIKSDRVPARVTRVRGGFITAHREERG